MSVSHSSRLRRARDDNEDTEALLSGGSGKPVSNPALLNRNAMHGRIGAYISLIFSGSRRRVLVKLLFHLTGIAIIFGILVSLLGPANYSISRYGAVQTADDANLNLPPHYTEYYEHIRNLPQHNTSLPFPEGAKGRYIQFSSQIGQLGWNNVLNEVLLNAHLAYRSNRAYVFHDYEWKKAYYQWPESLMYEDPPRTPLAALLSGPVVGDPWAEDVKAAVPTVNVTATSQGMGEGKAPYGPPRAVSLDYWNLVCPPHKRRVIVTNMVKPWHKFDTNAASGTEIFNIWMHILTDKEALDRVSKPNPLAEDDNCVEIVSAPREEDNFPQVFDLWLWGSTRVLDLWEEFKNSPIASIGLGTGPVIERGVQRNLPLFTRHRLTDSKQSEDPMDRTLAVHVRRGDYKGACQGLADYDSTYYSWNQLPFLPDHFTPPPYPAGKEHGDGNNTKENVAVYLTHCLPTDEAIVQKIIDSRADWEAETGHRPSVDPKTGAEEHYIDTLFLLTNEKDKEWLAQVREPLTEEKGWKNVVISSLEVEYGDAQEKDVGMAIDMDLARRAAVFIGNGFSSFTSNILHRRLVDGKIPISNRFF